MSVAKPIKVPPVLVVEPDLEAHERLKLDPLTIKVPLCLAETGKKAQLLLSEQTFSAIYVNSNIQNPHSLSVIRFALRTQPTTPLFVIGDGGTFDYTPEVMKNIGIQDKVQKPLDYSGLLKRVFPPAFLFDQEQVIRQSQLAQEKPTESEVTGEVTEEAIQAQELDPIEDQGYVPMPASKFISGSTSLFDIFVRLESGKYLKILKAGDHFDVDRIQNYIKKGIRYFYYRREAQENYLKYCDKLSSGLIQVESVSNRSKLDHVAHHGQNTANFFRTMGVSAENLNYAAGFVTRVFDLVKKLGIKNESMLVKDLLSGDEELSHPISSVFIASMVARQIGFEASKSVKIVGLAALFHDIALQNAPEVVQGEDATQIPDEHIRTFRAHPINGGKILESIPGIDLAVCQAVSQHHIRRDGTGFPVQVGLATIALPAEIIGISEEYARYIEKMKKKDAQPVTDSTGALTLPWSVLNGFGAEVVEAFHKIFGKPALKK